MRVFQVKNSVVIIIILVIFPVCGLNGDFLLGLKRGINLNSQYDFEPVMKQGMGWGLNGGIFSTITLYKKVLLQVEILISNKGRKELVADITRRIILTYLDIPLLIKYNFLESWISSSIYVGVQPSVNLSGVDVWADSYGEDSFKIQKEERTSFDIGVSVGAEIGFPIKSIVFFLDFRYTIGFVSTFFGERAKNSVFSLFIEYGISL